jgi:hypothetical protein
MLIQITFNMYFCFLNNKKYFKILCRNLVGHFDFFSIQNFLSCWEATLRVRIKNTWRKVIVFMQINVKTYKWEWCKSVRRKKVNLQQKKTLMEMRMVEGWYGGVFKMNISKKKMKKKKNRNKGGRFLCSFECS